MIKSTLICLLISICATVCHGVQLQKSQEEIQLLNGEWEFFWDTLMTPQQIGAYQLPPEQITVPASWTEFGYPANGKATYRLLVTGCDPTKELALFIPKIWSNSKVWVNQVLVSHRGELEMIDSRNNTLLETLTPVLEPSDTYEIVVQVANADIFIGGLIYPFELGNYEPLAWEKIITEAIQTLWIGSMFIMGLYHLLLFFFRTRDIVYLLLSVITFLLVIKMMVFGENIIYQALKEFKVLDFKWQNSLYYVSTYAVAGFGALYIHCIYPNVGNQKLSKIAFYIILAYCMFILIAPLKFYADTVLPFQVIVGVVVVYIFFMIFMGIRKNKSITSRSIQMAGILVMVLAAMNDGLREYGLKTTLPQEILPYSFLIVILLQMVMLAFERSESFKKYDELIEDLEERVLGRTRVIEKQKKELVAKSEELQQINQMKDKYFNNISHDLRSPLNVVLGHIQLAQLDQNEMQEQQLSLAERAVLRLRTLIEQITLLITINKKGLKLDFVASNLISFIHDQIEPLRYQAESKDIQITFQPTEELLEVDFDPGQFFRVVQNLLTNAIQHTPKGGKIAVDVLTEEDKVTIQFANTGDLIDPEVALRIFDRYFSMKTARSSGMGIGLELTKEIVELHQGSIEVLTENDMNCFRITMPVVQPLAAT